MKLQNFLFIYDTLHGRLPTVLNYLFEPSNLQHKYPTNFSGHDQISLFKANTLSYGLNSTKYKSVSFWNIVAKKNCRYETPKTQKKLL